MMTAAFTLRATARRSLAAAVAALLLLTPIAEACAENNRLNESLRALLAVGREGQGQEEASRAWRRLAAADAKQLPVLLAALDEASPLAANWVALAVDTVAERALDKGNLPADELEAFVLATEHAPRGRRLAFEWLRRADEARGERLVLGFLNDPSAELRREAVARLLEQAASQLKSGDKAAARETFELAMSSACDLDQVNQLKQELEKLGTKIDLAAHFGFIVRWKLIGPFDNTGERGFDAVYPPEREIDLAAEYDGKPLDGKPRRVRWTDYTTADELGVVDLYKAVLKENSVVAYALADFDAEEERPVELRLGRDNAARIWLNGRLVHEHRVYHSGSEMDQFVARVDLQPGRNRILVKVLQNNPPEDWAQTWSFQLRVCDMAGAAVLSTSRAK